MKAQYVAHARFKRHAVLPKSTATIQISSLFQQHLDDVLIMCFILGILIEVVFQVCGNIRYFVVGQAVNKDHL